MTTRRVFFLLQRKIGFNVDQHLSAKIRYFYVLTVITSLHFYLILLNYR